MFSILSAPSKLIIGIATIDHLLDESIRGASQVCHNLRLLEISTESIV